MGELLYWPLLVVTGLAGALVASYTPDLYFKPVMLATIMGMTLLILVRPGTVIPPEGTFRTRSSGAPAEFFSADLLMGTKEWTQTGLSVPEKWSFPPPEALP